MTIDEAIKHCEEQVTKYERQCGFGISKEGKEYNSQCAADHRQLAEWLRELKEAKRLLRIAVDDFDTMHNHIWDCTDCKSCPLNKGELGICGQMWRYADEAEKLLKEAENA